MTQDQRPIRLPLETREIQSMLIPLPLRPYITPSPLRLRESRYTSHVARAAFDMWKGRSAHMRAVLRALHPWLLSVPHDHRFRALLREEGNVRPELKKHRYRPFRPYRRVTCARESSVDLCPPLSFPLRLSVAPCAFPMLMMLMLMHHDALDTTPLINLLTVREILRNLNAVMVQPD